MMKVSEMEIPTRLKNELQNRNIVDSCDITDEVIDSLKEIRGIGKVKIDILISALADIKDKYKPADTTIIVEQSSKYKTQYLEDLPISDFARFIVGKIVDIIEGTDGIRKSSFDTSTSEVDIYINKKNVFIEKKYATSIFFTYKNEFIEFDTVKAAVDELMEIGLIEYNSNSLGEKFAYSRYPYLHSNANFMKIDLEKFGNMINRTLVPYLYDKNKYSSAFINTFGEMVGNKHIADKIHKSTPVKHTDLLKQESDNKKDIGYDIFITQYLSSVTGYTVNARIYKKHTTASGYVMEDVGMLIYDSCTDKADIICKDSLTDSIIDQLKTKIKKGEEK